tara:strand:+ start:3469 stop:4065 length:597 start_codon:yes stop_codon:yes gene_type:complete
MLHAFGDSFTYGYELSDCPTNTHPTPSMLTYSALTANHLGLDYHCHAQGYASNNGILRQIKLADVEFEDTCVVMWTYPVRYAFMFAGDRGWRTIAQDEDRWYWENVDQEPAQCLDRTLDSILAAHRVLNSRRCNYVFLCNNIELQNEIQYNSKWLNNDHWFFLPENHEMLNHTSTHPGDAVHRDVFNILKDRLHEYSR